MPRLTRTFLVAACLASALQAQTPADSVRRIDDLWARAYATLDTAQINRLFSPAIVVTTSSGTPRTRAAEIADNAPSPGLVMHSFRTRIAGINLHDSGATLMGEAEWDLSANGQRQRVPRRYTATYTRGGPFGWQMTALHFFPPAPSGPPVAAPADAGVAGRWEGRLNGNGLLLVAEITRAADGLFFAILRSPDQGGGQIPVERVRQDGDSLHIEIPVIGARYDAALSPDKTQLIGIFQQGRATPLTITRTAAAPATTTAPAPPNPFGLFLDVSTPTRPQVFTGNGKRHLVYELHVVNLTGGDLLLTKLEVLGPAGALATYDGPGLAAIVQQPRPNVTDPRSIPQGIRALAFIQVTLDSGVAAPTSIRHRFTAGSQAIETAPVTVAVARPIVIGAPFKGENWKALNGPGNISGHRRTLIPIDGHGSIAQRFAIDWVQVGESGATYSGNALDNKSYRGYGAEIIAVADGIVTSTKDSIPENVPGATSRAVPINFVTLGGNYVMQDLGGGRYAFYAHLQPGSLRVKTGQRVRKGQVIGLLGNSGNSTEPHLHFQVVDGPSPLATEGVPYHIDAWEIRLAGGKWDPRVNEIPMQDAIIRVPAPPAVRKP
jgi:murein DD-endopeptidase